MIDEDEPRVFKYSKQIGQKWMDSQVWMHAGHHLAHNGWYLE